MKRKLFVPASIGFVALVFFTGCKLNNDWEEMEKDELNKFSQYISNLQSQGADLQSNVIGSYTWYYEDLGNFAEPGISPVLNDYIILDYVRRELSGDIVYTNIDSLADDWTIFNQYKDSYSHYLFAPSKIQFGYNTIGFNAGMSMTHEGQRARFYMPSGLAFGDHVSIIDEVKLYRVISDIEAYDSAQVAWFVNSKSLDEQTYLSSENIFYNEITPGDTTIDIEATDSLKLKFVAYYLQEQSLIKYDSIWGTTDDIFVTVPSTRSKVENFAPKGFAPFSKGFAAVMDTVAVGTEGLVLVPYAKGFGTTGLVQSLLRFMVVPPYSSLVYKFRIIGKK